MIVCVKQWLACAKPYDDALLIPDGVKLSANEDFVARRSGLRNVIGASGVGTADDVDTHEDARGERQ